MSKTTTQNKKSASVDNTTPKQRGGITGKGFLPGQSGNPAGRPKGAQSMTTLLKFALENFSTGTETKFDEMIIRRALLKAAAGDNEMIKLMFDRIDGRAKEHITHDLANKEAFEGIMPNVLGDLMQDYKRKVKEKLRKGHGRTGKETK